jgi:hypothetical protein
MAYPTISSPASAWANRGVSKIRMGRALQSDFTVTSDTVRYWRIEQTDIPPGESYAVTAPIPVRIVREGELDFIGSFEEAYISISGESFHDAFLALVLEVLDTFDYLLSHRSDLGPWPEQQLAILERHLVKTNG